MADAPKLSLQRNSRDRAKRIIIEIIRQAGGKWENKTNLFKAFWRAHLKYAEEHLDYLSTWPIVRLPYGPGIDQFDRLMGELMADKIVGMSDVPKGNYSAMCFELLEPCGDVLGDLTESQIAAIKHGVSSVKGRTARRVSVESHIDSRMWNELEDGREIDVVLDLIPQEEYVSRSASIKTMSDEIDRILGTSIS